MMQKRGQAALEFLMTYGWAFLVMIAVIAGIVALDPLGAAQVNVGLCQFSQPWNCDTDAMVLSNASQGTVNFQLTNIGQETYNVSAINISGENGASDTSCSLVGSGSLPTLVSPDEDIDAECTNILNSVEEAEIASGNQYDFEGEVEYRQGSLGSTYIKVQTANMRVAAN